MEQQQKLIIEKLESNISKAGKDTADIFLFLKGQQLNPLAAYLRINTWDDFSVLIVLPKAAFLNDKMLRVYAYIADFEARVEEEMYQIQVSFCDAEDHIDEHFVRADGFSLKYKMK